MITMIYENGIFQKFIEKHREFIVFYGKYDYFHFRVVPDPILVTPPARKSPPEEVERE